MIPYRPAHAPIAKALGQAPMISAQQFVAAAALNPPTPVIDTVFAGYEGIPGILASAALLALTGSAAYLGIKTGLESPSKTMKTVGWVGGVGSALLGLMYLGQKSGLSIGTGLPALNVYPA